jgi:hypothetical protein
MRKLSVFLSVLSLCIAVLGFSTFANAALTVSGTVFYDGADRNLIYDDVKKITWLDYTAPAATWDTQKAWADNLSFTVNGKTYSDWRLPTTAPGTDYGFNITTAEMGYLYYISLGKPLGGPLGDTSPFKDIKGSRMTTSTGRARSTRRITLTRGASFSLTATRTLTLSTETDTRWQCIPIPCRYQEQFFSSLPVLQDSSLLKEESESKLYSEIPKGRVKGPALFLCLSLTIASSNLILFGEKHFR